MQNIQGKNLNQYFKIWYQLLKMREYEKLRMYKSESLGPSI